MTNVGPPGGRRREATRNDERILRAAREVFLDDPSAPIAAVAARAGVGISALYRRHQGKDALLGLLCAQGQGAAIAEARRALADRRDPWTAYASFLRRIVADDAHALSTRLVGAFTPTPEHQANARRLRELGEQLLARAQQAGAVRADVTFGDVALLLDAVTRVRVGDARRSAEVRERLLALLADALRAGTEGVLPGVPPDAGEPGVWWVPAVTGAAAAALAGNGRQRQATGQAVAGQAAPSSANSAR